MRIHSLIAIIILIIASPAFAYVVHMQVPAVLINADQGVLTTVYLNVTSGTGAVFVNVPNGTVANDTMHSAASAATYAASMLNLNKNNYNFNFTINNIGRNLSGPSAGLAFTLLSIGGLEHKQLDPNFTVTGTINANGMVGQIGGAYDKIQAAKLIGENFVLVPYASNSTFEYLIYYLSQQANGIPVVQVNNVSDALPYAFRDAPPSLLRYNITTDYKVSSLPEAEMACNGCNQSSFWQVANATFALVSFEINQIDSTKFFSAKSQLSSQLSQYRKLAASGYFYSAANLAFLEFPTAFVFANYNDSDKASATSIVQDVSQYCNSFNATPQMTTTNYEYIAGGEIRRAWALNALNAADAQLNSSQTSDDVLLALDEAAPAYSWCAATSFMYNISQQSGGSPVALPQSIATNVSSQLASAQAHYGSLPYVEAARYDYGKGDYAAALYSIAYADVFYGNRSDLSYNRSTLANLTALVNYSMSLAKGVWPTQFAIESSFYASEAQMPNESNATRAAYLNSAYATATLADQLSSVNSKLQASFIPASQQQQYSNSTQLGQIQQQMNLILGVLLVILVLIFGIFLLLLLILLQNRDRGARK